MKYKLIITLGLLTLIGVDLLAHPKIDSLISRINAYETITSIRPLTKNGKTIEFFPSVEARKFSEYENTYLNFLSEMESISKDSLDESSKIDLAILNLMLSDMVAYYRYKIYFIPFNAEGGFYNEVIYYTNDFSIESIEDGELYLEWLKQLSEYLIAHKNLLVEGVNQGLIAPKKIVENTLVLMEPFTNDQIDTNPLYVPFNNLTLNKDEKDVKLLIESSRDFFKSTLIPAYKDLHIYFKEDYYNKAYEMPGISNIPKGAEYYENRVQHYSTLNLSSDEIYELGLKEVDRIMIRMQDCIKALKFEGSFQDFIKFLRTDKQFYAKEPSDLLEYASWLSKKAEGQLPKYFNKLYSLPFTVEAVPASIAPTYTSGRYVHGSWKSSKPGIYWVNTYNLESRPLYALPALTLHEAVPGHHLQTQFAAEQDNLSNLRRHYYISAFGEGWGLYSEYLGEEMKMYVDNYDLFGRLTYEMWRACRLVVDTGIHSKSWSRKKAVDYLASHTALSLHEVNTEIDRYIGWPGQAISYKIGELKILELRNRAEQELGEKFDIREFHYEILKNGSVPLVILESEIERYISQNK